MPSLRLIKTTPLFFLVCLTSACQQSRSAQETRNEETVHEFFAAIDAGELDRVRQLVSDDLALHILGLPEPFGPDELIGAIEAFYAAFPDNTHVIEQTMVEDDLVAVRLTQHATHRGEYEGIPATGERVTIGAIHMMRFADGVIQQWWALEDNLGLMQQLGMELTRRQK